MRKKLQVFVSSTYEDLKVERQSAVQAILTAGHIPAGMELFSAGDESQKEIIKKWIHESDVYLLILGGRYGSMDNSTGMSYTHWEYEYAGEIGKPRFAVVISDSSLETKIRNEGTIMMEKDHPELYKKFRKEVLSKLVKIYDDTRDIQLAIFHKMGEYSSREDLVGWVHGSDVPNAKELINDNARLSTENIKLKDEIMKLKDNLKQQKAIMSSDFDGTTFEGLKETLKKISVSIPSNKDFGDVAGQKFDVFTLFVSNKDTFATGIDNAIGMSYGNKFLYYHVAPKLLMYGLLEKVKVSGVRYERIQTTKQGFAFLRLVEELILNKRAEKEVSTSNESGKKKSNISNNKSQSTIIKKPSRKRE